MTYRARIIMGYNIAEIENEVGRQIDRKYITDLGDDYDSHYVIVYDPEIGWESSRILTMKKYLYEYNEKVTYQMWTDVTFRATASEEYVFENEDVVNHPSHYTKGKIEVWDFIVDQDLNYLRGNAIKYICRAGSKDPSAEIQDIKKAIAYLNREIKRIQDNG